MPPLFDRTHGRTRLAVGAATIALLVGAPAAALPVPVGGLSPVSAGGGQPIIQSSGSTVRVDLNAPRTIIDWQNFNLGSGERADFLFDQRNWIVLNRVNAGAINIDGQVFAAQAAGLNSPVPANASGNVWFYSPQGVVFGPNARANVGGLLATSAVMNTGAFLSPANLNIPFTGSGSGGPVTVAAGAQLNATAHVALVAPRVTTAAGSTTTVSDYGTALYGAADTYEIQFFPTFNNDLTLFTFIVPGRAAGTPITQALTVAGQTTSGTIYLAAYSRAAVASEMINAPGLLTARSSFAEYGQVTITTGRNIILGQPGPGEDGPLAHINTGLTTGAARIGEINADGNVNVILSGVDFDMGPLGNFTATKIRAGQALLIGGNVINIPGGVSSGDTGVNFRSARIVAGQQLTIPTITAGGDLFFGSRFAGSTFDRATSGGNLSMLNAQTVSGNLLSSVGSLTVSSGGPINVARVSGGAVSLSTASTVNVATLSGSSINIGSVGAQTVGSATGTGPVIIRTGGLADIVSITGPTLQLDATTARLGTVAVAGDVRLRIGSFGLQNSLTATNLTIEAASGNYVLGGNTAGSLSDAEFQRIRLTGSLSVYGGVTAPTVNVPTPVYGDIEVQSLTLDPLRIPNLYLFANPDHEVRIVGPVDTVGQGAGLVRIGDPGLGSAWAPRTIKFMDPSDPIDITAVLDAPELQNGRAIELYATGDILIGSRRFVDLVGATPADQVDLVRGLPSGVGPTAGEENLLYILAGRLTMAAGGRILSQNTSPVGKEVGIVLTGVGVPQGEPILTIGRSQKTDIFVSFVSGGSLSNGQQLALSDRIGRLAGDTSSGSILINGCALGIGCSTISPATQFRVETFRPVAAQVAIDAPVLSPPPPVDDDDREPEMVITGSGNEEIWRDRK